MPRQRASFVSAALDRPCSHPTPQTLSPKQTIPLALKPTFAKGHSRRSHCVRSWLACIPFQSPTSAEELDQMLLDGICKL